MALTRGLRSYICVRGLPKTQHTGVENILKTGALHGDQLVTAALKPRGCNYLPLTSPLLLGTMAPGISSNLQGSALKASI